jgi:hypothetical protein
MTSSRSLLLVAASIVLFNLSAVASGAPCWDAVPPAQKYAQRHMVNGSDNQLSADGLIVSTKKSVTSGGIIRVELTVTNCSTAAVEVLPNKYDLEVLGPGGTENDKRLPRLDPTQFPHPNNPKRSAPALHPETLTYGSVGFYTLFFSPDSYYSNMDHSEHMAVLIGKWQFDFYFRKEKTQ